MTKIRFSVVIPCFNEEACLPDTLASLAQQDFQKGYEIIVVDNNCTDGTVKIATQFGARVVSEDRAGVCFARQAGTEAASGEIVISTDADTIFDRDWLTEIDKKFRESSSVVAVCGPCEFMAAPWWGRMYTKILFGGVRAYYLLTHRTTYITATNTAFYKSAWDGYDTTLTQGGDELGLLHSLRKHGKVKFTLDYIVHTSSRRINHGLWYNLFVTYLYYYLFAFYVNRIFRRTIIGNAPAYREVSLTKRARDKFIKLSNRMITIKITPTVSPSAAAATSPEPELSAKVLE